MLVTMQLLVPQKGEMIHAMVAWRSDDFLTLLSFSRILDDVKDEFRTFSKQRSVRSQIRLIAQGHPQASLTLNSRQSVGFKQLNYSPQQFVVQSRGLSGRGWFNRTSSDNV
jgi:hypothetical protein